MKKRLLLFTLPLLFMTCAAGAALYQDFDGEWLCDLDATWASFGKEGQFTRKEVETAFKGVRLSLDFTQETLFQSTEGGGRQSLAIDTLSIEDASTVVVVQTSGVTTVFTLRDNNTLIAHNPESPNLQIVFKRQP